MIRLVFVFLVACFFSFSAKAQIMENGRPDTFPTPPKDNKLLFFIQRNKNTNTIVYDANLDSNGNFVKNKPVDVYWRRYTSTGYRKELGWLERTFAYGYSSKKDASKTGYWIELTAWDGRKIHVRKSTDGKPFATLTCNGKECKLEYIYVFVDESSTWPRVIHVDIHATDLYTGEPEFERILNN